MSTIICPNCAFENTVDAGFCENCGTPLTFRCSNCGEALTPNARFCKHCGSPQTGAHIVDVSSRFGESRGDDLGDRGERSRLAALHRSMPSSLAQKMRSMRGHLDGERKQVTVLFTDIVDSTQLAERMDPEEWGKVVNGAHRLVSEQVYRYEGTVAQLLGDGVLCFFGAPVIHEDDTERAVRAALAIRDEVKEYAGRVSATFGIANFRLRIGLNTGLVVVGEVGSSLHFEYLAVGDTVNLAARMQAEADPNSILLTEKTQRLVQTLFEFQDRGELSVKGKSGPVHAYKVVAEKIGAPKRRGVSGLHSPMVGRERELAALEKLTEELLSGKGGIVNVLGEAGLGKSRLLAEWKNWVFDEERVRTEDGKPRTGSGSNTDSDLIAPKYSIRWAEGRCLSFGVKAAYHLVVDLTRSLLDVSPALPDQEMREQIQARLKELFANEPALYEEGYPFLAQLLSLRLEPEQAERVRYLPPETLRAQFVNVISRAFRALARETATIIVCEDIHWADPSSVELLSQLLSLVKELPLLVCLVARPDRDLPGWHLIEDAREVPGVGAIEIHLAALSGGDTSKLVSNLVDQRLPGKINELILARSEGNPFFVEEVIGMLIDKGIIRRGETGWIVSQGIGQVEIPETIQGVLMGRVDQLPDEARRTLQVASVIGREFSFELLLKVLDKQETKPERV